MSLDVQVVCRPQRGGDCLLPGKGSSGGELRGADTAMTAAEMGHLLIATLQR